MSFWLILIAGEAVLVVFALLFASWIGQVLGKRRDRDAVRTLVDRVTAQKEQRAEAIRAFLRANFAFGEAQLDAHSMAVLREELRLYQRFANLYLRRDAGSVSNFQIPFETCVAPYWELKGEVRGSEAPIANQGVVELMPAPDDSQVDSLRAEIDQLRQRSDHVSEQLRLAIKNLASMLDEYSSLFDGSTTDDLSGAPLIAEARELIAEADQLGVGVNVATEADTDAEASESPGVGTSVDDSVDKVMEASTDISVESEPEPGSETAPEDEEASRSAVTGDTSGSEMEVEPAALTDPDDSPTPDERSEESGTPSSDAGDVGLEFEVDEFLAESPDDEPVADERADSEVSNPDSPHHVVPPAADELMASLDANLTEVPEESPQTPEPAIADAEIDDLFDAEPGFDIAESLVDESGRDSDTSLDADERDDEAVAIVEKG